MPSTFQSYRLLWGTLEPRFSLPTGRNAGVLPRHSERPARKAAALPGLRSERIERCGRYFSRERHKEVFEIDLSRRYRDAKESGLVLLVVFQRNVRERGGDW